MSLRFMIAFYPRFFLFCFSYPHRFYLPSNSFRGLERCAPGRSLPLLFFFGGGSDGGYRVWELCGIGLVTSTVCSCTCVCILLWMYLRQKGGLRYEPISWAAVDGRKSPSRLLQSKRAPSNFDLQLEYGAVTAGRQTRRCALVSMSGGTVC